jgi:hypothetical protein
MQSFGRASRLDLNHPPTAVGGIRDAVVRRASRLGLNDPPTAVGGIRDAVVRSCF